MSGDELERRQERAMESWRNSPVTALVISWLMPEVWDLMTELISVDLDDRGIGIQPDYCGRGLCAYLEGHEGRCGT